MKLQLNPFDASFGIHLRLRRRVDLLVWARLGLWLVTPMTVWFLFRNSRCAPCVVGIVVVAIILGKSLSAWEQSLRRQFVRDALLPRFLVGKLQAAYPHLSAGDCDLVLRGLRQFFMAHLRSGRQFVGMPSKVVDAAWHEFILHTQAYQMWCNSAFGSLLHHTPAEVLGGNNSKRNDSLRRTWYWACKEESIAPRAPTRLPLLFALDKKFGIEGGYRYEADCKSIDNASSSNSYCGSDFSDGGSGASGDSGGFGGSESSASSGSSGDGGSDGGSSCGGGCGGD
jgi:hypothetical protein